MFKHVYCKGNQLFASDRVSQTPKMEMKLRDKFFVASFGSNAEHIA